MNFRRVCLAYLEVQLSSHQKSKKSLMFKYFCRFSRILSLGPRWTNGCLGSIAAAMLPSVARLSSCNTLTGASGPARTVMCSLHKKKRKAKDCETDGMGGWMCLPGHECDQFGEEDQSGPANLHELVVLKINSIIQWCCFARVSVCVCVCACAAWLLVRAFVLLFAVAR